MEQRAPAHTTAAAVPVELFLHMCKDFAKAMRLDGRILDLMLTSGLWESEPGMVESLESLFRRFAHAWRLCESARVVADDC